MRRSGKYLLPGGKRMYRRKKSPHDVHTEKNISHELDGKTITGVEAREEHNQKWLGKSFVADYGSRGERG